VEGSGEAPDRAASSVHKDGESFSRRGGARPRGRRVCSRLFRKIAPDHLAIHARSRHWNVQNQSPFTIVRFAPNFVRDVGIKGGPRARPP